MPVVSNESNELLNRKQKLWTRIEVISINYKLKIYKQKFLWMDFCGIKHFCGIKRDQLNITHINIKHYKHTLFPRRFNV